MKEITSENLKVYLKQINKIPLLTREEEETYARLARKGDKVAKDKLVTANLRFVVNVAKKYQNQGVPLLDLISEGNIGLMTAVDKFDVDKGFHFISYAVWWIRQAILKAICEKSRLIRLPLNRANELVQIQKAKKTIHSSKTEHEEIQAIAKMLSLDSSHVRDMLLISREMVSLETPVAINHSTSVLGDFLEDKQHQLPENYAIEQTLKTDIDSLLENLPEKEALVLRYRFGLDGYKQMSLKELGSYFSLTKERIRQIEKKAIQRLQQPIARERLSAYVA